MSLLFLLCLAGCSVDRLNHDQARLCRIVVRGLLGDAAKIDILAQHMVEVRGVDSEAVRIDYESQRPGKAARVGFAECGFVLSEAGPRLRFVRLPDGFMSLPRLYMLQRFWLDIDEARAADPLPFRGTGHTLTLPVGAGYPVQQIINALPSASVYGLLAAAYALIYGLVGRINLAFGAFAATGGGAAILAGVALAHWPTAAVVAGVLVVGIACASAHGIVTGHLVFSRLHRVTGQQSLVATIGLALFLDEYVRLAQGSQPRWMTPMLDDPFIIAQDPTFSVTVTPMTLTIAALSGLAVLVLLGALRWHRFGREWRAYSDDPRAAALFGVGRDRIFTTTFAIACALAGLAGCLTVLAYGEIGLGYATTLGIKALTAAVLGGIGSVPGAFLGGLFIGLVETGWSAAFPSVHRDLVLFALLVACLIWRPGGFFGDRELSPRKV